MKKIIATIAAFTMAFALCSCGRSADSEPAAVQPSEVTTAATAETAADTAAVTTAPQSEPTTTTTAKGEPTTTTTAESETTTSENTTTADVTTTSDSKTTTTAEKKTTTAKQTAAPKKTTTAKQTAAPKKTTTTPKKTTAKPATTTKKDTSQNTSANGIEFWQVYNHPEYYWEFSDAQKKDYERWFRAEYGYWEEPYRAPNWSKPLSTTEYNKLNLKDQEAYQKWFYNKYGYELSFSETYNKVIDEHSKDLVNKFVEEELRLINEERAKVGVAPLKADPNLQAAANIRAQEIDELFSHTRPDGRDCFSVKDDMGISSYRLLAENIAQVAATPQDVVNSWMASPAHKASILNSEYTYVGLGVYITRIDVYSESVHGNPIFDYSYYANFGAVQLFAVK